MSIRIDPRLASPLLAGLWTMAAAEENTEPFKEWNPVEIEGIDYVPIESLKKFYHFDRLTEDETGTVTLHYPNLNLQMNPEQRWIHINRVRVELCRPLKLDERGGILVSAMDLSKTIDPIVRPSYIEKEKEGSPPQKIAVTITKANDLKASIDSETAPSDASGSVFLHLQPGEGPLSLKTEVLAPVGVDDGDLPDKSEKPLSGNEFDQLNIALAVACHSYLLVDLAEVEDLGIDRSHHADLSAARGPAARLTLSVPENFDDWATVSKTLERAVLKYQKALGRGLRQ